MLWKHRPATLADLPAIMGVITQAQAFLRAQAVDQWQHGYPNAASFSRDMERGECHVFLEGSAIVGVLAVTFGEEPAYQAAELPWLNPTGNYAVIHRIAVRGDRHGTGLSEEMIRAASAIARKNGARSIRADTHRGNQPMERLMQKCRFTPCGEVCYPYTEGDPYRTAYERLL